MMATENGAKIGLSRPQLRSWLCTCKDWLRDLEDFGSQIVFWCLKAPMRTLRQSKSDRYRSQRMSLFTAPELLMSSRNLTTTRFFFLVLLVAGLATTAWAHGGRYTGPGSGSGGTPGPGPGSSARSGGTTAGTNPSWTNWWQRNREEFFDIRGRRIEQSGQDENTQGKYDDDAAHAPATKDDVRNLVIPTLVGIAKDKSAEVRDAVAIALGRAGEVPQTKILQALLADKNRKVRQAAIMGLGLLKHPMAQQTLVELLNASNTAYKERGMTAIALGIGGGDKAEKALLNRLGRSQPFSRLSAIKTRQVDGCRAVGLGLMKRDQNAIPIIQAVNKDQSKERNFAPMALTALGKIGERASASVGLKALKHRKNDLRRSAAIMMGRTVTKDDTKTIKSLLKHWKSEKDSHARYFLTISLGRIGSDDVLKVLRHNLKKNKNREDRAFSALALGIAKDSESIAMLEETLEKEKDVSFRGALAIALGIMDHRPSAKMIHGILKKTRNPDLRSSLITAMAMLDYRESLKDVRMILAEGRNERLVRACGLALAVMFDKDSLELMVSVMKNSGSIQVKGGMATAIGRTGDRRSLKSLVDIIKSDAETDLTRAFAVVALGLIGDKTPKSEFARVAIDSNYAMINAEALLEVIDIF